MRHNPVDEKYMRIVLSLAKKGIGATSPNPAVGACLVKSGKIIASAYHRRAGSMHAEASAIKMAGKEARGATLYSTLEACTHYGKTPPCVNAIIKSGIKKAVFAMKDPNPVNYGRGIARLKKAGIKTECGILQKESEELNRPFIKFMKKHRPYVTIKIAQSMDGKIGDAEGRSKWITSKPSRALVHKLRGRNDAVMIGVNTLLKDDPLLTSRTGRRVKRQPLRIILDTNLRTPAQSHILKNGKAAPGKVLIVAGSDASSKKKALLEKRGAKVILLPRKNGRIDIRRLMKYLADVNITSILCEGGGELTASLLKMRLADEVFFFISPRIIGGRSSPTSCDGPYSDIRKSFKIKDVNVGQIGPDVLIRGYV